MNLQYKYKVFKTQTNSRENHAHKVKFFRERAGLTQAEMAKTVGITKRAYALKEQGRRGFTTEEAKMIIKTYKSFFGIFFWFSSLRFENIKGGDVNMKTWVDREKMTGYANMGFGMRMDKP